MNEISRADVELLFRKLAEENAEVICVGELWGWRLMLRGKIVARPSEITFLTGEGNFVFRLDNEDTVFTYSEPGRMSLPELAPLPPEIVDSLCISVALPLRVRLAEVPSLVETGDPGTLFREKLIFVEIRGNPKIM